MFPHIEINSLICRANQLTGFYRRRNICYYFIPVVSFYTPWKKRGNSGFPLFTRGTRPVARNGLMYYKLLLSRLPSSSHDFLEEVFELYQTLIDKNWAMSLKCWKRTINEQIQMTHFNQRLTIFLFLLQFSNIEPPNLTLNKSNLIIWGNRADYSHILI